MIDPEGMFVCDACGARYLAEDPEAILHLLEELWKMVESRVV